MFTNVLVVYDIVDCGVKGCFLWKEVFQNWNSWNCIFEVSWLKKRLNILAILSNESYFLQNMIIVKIRDVLASKNS